ncbi:SLN13 protein, partial [Baryphthengus martii]|nr:SLN13 protein [Baryphthengus martii]
NEHQGKVRVESGTAYPELVLSVGKICFGEKARQKIPKHSKQDQKCTLAYAVCALLNSGGGVVKAEIANENYSLERDKIGSDLEGIFRSLLLIPDLKKYLDFKQQDNYLLIFIKSWSSENTSSTSAKPRICSLSTGLYAKCGASLSHMNPTEALLFLKGKQEEARRELSPGPPAKIRNTEATEGDRDFTNETAAELFNRDRLRRGETLTFTESRYVEFKHFATDKFLTRVRELLPQYVAGFANTGGGYLWIGVDDDGRVQGFSSDDEDLDKLNRLIDSIQTKLTLFHFCQSGTSHDVRCECKIFPVSGEAGERCGYVCAIKVHPFTCVAFSEDPESWLVEGGTVRRLRADEWALRMTDADPDLSKLSETFRLELSLTDGPPLAKPVYSHQGLDNVDDLCKQLFPVVPDTVTCVPEKLCEDLFQEHPGLRILMENQWKQLSEAILIFSRSWAVEVGLPENQAVICDVLLIAKDRPPVLYAVCEHQISKDFLEYPRHLAQRLKEKLVNTGGYINKLCIMPKLLTLSPQTNCEKEWDMNIQEMYPQDYSLISSDNLKSLLCALTVALLTFESFLSDRVGSEFLNLLTLKQYQLLSENLHKTKRLYVYGLPGTGKTVVALKIIEKIRTMRRCTKEEVLYVCENQPLRDFVRQKNICRAETRVSFLKMSCRDVKHIIIDEAQNFRKEDGDWYAKACALTSAPHLTEPGYFWIFLDYLQKSHCFQTGLPGEGWHDPFESLTKVVRNAHSIYSYLEGKMKMIVKDPTLGIPKRRLEDLLARASCAHTVQGWTEERCLDSHRIVRHVVTWCQTYLKKGYSEKDIAVLCYTDEAARAYQGILVSAMKSTSRFSISFRKMEGGLWKEHAVLDSIRRFSGLERSIVFGIVPSDFPYKEDILENILVCVASRANLNLHLLFENSN